MHICKLKKAVVRVGVRKVSSRTAARLKRESEICRWTSGTEISPYQKLNRLPREVVESPSLEIFKTHLDKVLCSLL